ncbi:hypothetical protein [Variovorax paradoxus]|uniref:hypothetical protein n=1 Tax=Variovorax paradoxus TaxID=34073 RepID=UPI003D65F766
MNFRRRLSILLLAYPVTSACFAQSTHPSVLEITRKSSFFSEGARRESADTVIRSMQEALAAGADLHEIDGYGNSAFLTVLLFASQDSRGEQANPIVQYLIAAGIDVNAGVSVEKRLYPICMPIMMHTLNTKLVILLLNAGARKKVRCIDRELEAVAEDDPLDSPFLSNLLKKYK